MKNKSMNRALTILLLLIAGGAGFYIWKKNQPPGLPRGIAAGNGRLEATEVDVAAKQQGRVAAVLVNEGDMVHPGQVLANMDAAVLEAQLREAEADKLRAETDRNVAAAVVGQHESEYDLAVKTLNRTRHLFQQKAVDQSQLDKDSGAEQTAAAIVAASKAQVASAEAAIAAAAAKIERVKADIADTVLKSPRGGRVEYRLVERVLGHGDTKSSVLVVGGFQADLRLVAADSRGAALQYFTGSKAHNIALRDRAIGRGLKLNEYGLFRTADDVRIAGEREEEIYEALGLDWVPPELREMRGEIAAAEAHALPRLIDVADLRGDLHMHTTETDGKDDIRAMAEAARAAGLEYIAITDHSQSLAMANGLDERRALAHAERIRAVDAERPGIRLLAGIECDIRADGSLDLADDCLAALDLVIVSVHSAFAQERQEMTDRLLRALENPHVDVLGHPTGRKILKRAPYAVDMEAIVDAAARHGVALEINCQVDRLDLHDVHARLARDRGVPLVIDTDAHSRTAFGRLRWGVLVARRAWLQPGDVLNTRPFDEFRAALRRHRRAAA